MLEREFQYFIDNQAELVAKYHKKYLVIKGDAVIGVYDTEADAYFETELKEELGTFLIQYCEAGQKAYSQTFHTRVHFA